MASKGLLVEQFRQILIWPLAMARSPDADPEWTPREGVKKQVKILKDDKDCRWKPIVDGLDHLDGKKCDNKTENDKYQEFVYFHEFVSNFLYVESKDCNEENRALHIFKRDDVHNVSVKLDGYPGHFELSVDRVRLYLFDIGVAALAVEVSASGKVCSDDDSPLFCLGDVLALSDQFRRAYPPYFESVRPKDFESVRPKAFPEKVLWRNCEKRDIFESQNCNKTDDMMHHVVNARRVPAAPHWRNLIGPLVIDGYEDNTENGKGKPSWRQIVDERIPVMTYVGMPAITAVSRGDWMRLCFVDSPGPGLPYAEDFLADFEKDFVYDRFWDRRKKTRYLFSGYAMAMATSNDWFAQKYLEKHFRRHYFQMGLIVHLQMSALLALSHQISCAVADNDEKDDPKEFEDRIASLHGEFLRLTHRYWFTGVSNQIQPREMYDLWRSRLGVHELYREVANEIREADEYLTLKRQERMAANNSRLTMIASLGLPLALAVGFLGMNIIVTGNGWAGWKNSASWSQLLLVTGFFGLVGVLFVSREIWILPRKIKSFASSIRFFKIFKNYEVFLIRFYTIISIGFLIYGFLLSCGDWGWRWCS